MIMVAGFHLSDPLEKKEGKRNKETNKKPLNIGWTFFSFALDHGPFIWWDML